MEEHTFICSSFIKQFPSQNYWWRQLFCFSKLICHWHNDGKVHIDHGSITNKSEVTNIQWDSDSATLDPFMADIVMKVYIFIQGSKIKPVLNSNNWMRQLFWYARLIDGRFHGENVHNHAWFHHKTSSRSQYLNELFWYARLIYGRYHDGRVHNHPWFHHKTSLKSQPLNETVILLLCTHSWQISWWKCT